MKHLFKRVFAYLIDCTLSFSIIMVIIQWMILSNIRESIGITNEWFQNSWNMEFYVLTSISLPIWLYFSYFDSNKSKGTIGKRIMNLSVRDKNSEKISFGQSLLRTFFKLLPWEISHIGIIFPTPIYFEEEPNIRILMILGIFLFITYFLSIIINYNNQSIYDKLIGTKVTEEENTI